MQPLSNGLRVMTMMSVRNEGDVIEEAVRELARWVPLIVVLDGGSTDGTYETLQRIARRQSDLDVELDLIQEDAASAAGPYQEYKREQVYRRARIHGAFDWCMMIDADEIFHTSPIQAIEWAEAEGAQCVIPFKPEFWLTVDDLRSGALVEDERISVQQRRLWYSWCWRENRIWREHPDLHYWPDAMHGKHVDPWRLDGRSWPELQSVTCLAHMLPILKHYPIRSVRQGIAKMEDRVPRGRRDFGKMSECWIMDEGFCQLRQFDGRWDYEPTQPRIRQWYAEARRRAEVTGLCAPR